MTKKERYENIVLWFEKNMPVAETELKYLNPFQLMVAVILSAQCTDARVNTVTPALFKKFPTSKKLAAAKLEDVFKLVRSVSYPNSKANHLIGMAQKLEKDFGGIVPSDIEALQTLPGVGRKTANVVASVIYNKPVIAVDTHVFRVAHRIGLVGDAATTPLKVEEELEKNIPEKLRAKAHHWLILHGRYVCVARAPKCDTCGIAEFCKYFKLL